MPINNGKVKEQGQVGKAIRPLCITYTYENSEVSERDRQEKHHTAVQHRESLGQFIAMITSCLRCPHWAEMARISFPHCILQFHGSSEGKSVAWHKYLSETRRCNRWRLSANSVSYSKFSPDRRSEWLNYTSATISGIDISTFFCVCALIILKTYEIFDSQKKKNETHSKQLIL